MGVQKRKKKVALFNKLTAVRATGIALSVVGIIALICVVGCKQAGVRSSGTSSMQAKAGTGQSEAVKVPELMNAQCVWCHPAQPETIATKGEKHKTEVGCQDCHTEHPPDGTGAVPECSMCHSDEPHYALEDCSSCHTDTHAPLDIKLEGEISGACLTCHQQQGDEVENNPSAHTDVPCNECHSAHKLIPDCTQCHEKHTDDMDFKACVSCHPVHMPLLITYAQDTPNHYCGADDCHAEAVGLLDANKSKHHDLACAFCHKNQHKTIPPCFACHPDPHPKAMMDKFPTCGDCHGIAHDLKA